MVFIPTGWKHTRVHLEACLQVESLKITSGWYNQAAAFSVSYKKALYFYQ